MRPSFEDFEQWNEEHARKYDLEKFYSHPNRLFRYIENKRIRVLIDFAEIEDTSRVLDLGCGAGHILEKINKGVLTGIDVSQTQILRAKRKLGPDIELIKAPGEKIPFSDKYFDRIICTEVFEHVLEPELVLKEMKRVLIDDGIISLSIPNEKLINLTKQLLLSLGLRRVLEPKQSGWDLASKNNLEEWHLHKYGFKLIKKQVSADFITERIAMIPTRFLPYRYVLKLRKTLNKAVI